MRDGLPSNLAGAATRDMRQNNRTRTIAPGQVHRDSYGIRRIFYGELTQQPNFHHGVGKIWRRD
jgi:hypothetical protein